MKVAQVGSEKVVDDKGIRMLNLDEDFGKLRVWEAVNCATPLFISLVPVLLLF